MSLKPGKHLTINPGLHLMHLALNGKTTLDPRLSAQYRFNQKRSLSLAYGLHSKTVPLGTYFYKPPSYPNHILDMMRAHHLIAAYNELLGNSWRLHAEL